MTYEQCLRPQLSEAAACRSKKEPTNSESAKNESWGCMGVVWRAVLTFLSQKRLWIPGFLTAIFPHGARSSGAVPPTNDSYWLRTLPLRTGGYYVGRPVTLTLFWTDFRDTAVPTSMW